MSACNECTVILKRQFATQFVIETECFAIFWEYVLVGGMISCHECMPWVHRHFPKSARYSICHRHWVLSSRLRLYAGRWEFWVHAMSAQTFSKVEDNNSICHSSWLFSSLLRRFAGRRNFFLPWVHATSMTDSCYTSETHRIKKFKSLGTHSNQTKISMWICTARYWGIWSFRSGGFGGCSIFGGICHT